MIFQVTGGWSYLAVLGVVLVCVFVPYIRKVSEWFVTIIHEFGHALVALLLGGGINGIKLHADGSGVTVTKQAQGLFYKLFRRIILFAGYSFPLYIGIALMVTVVTKNINVGMGILLVMGLLTFIFLRNWFGLVIILIYFAVLFAFWQFHTVLDGKYLVLFMGMLFVIRGIYDIVIVAKLVFRRDVIDESDFHLLANESWLPRQVWYIIFVLLQIFIIGTVFLAVNPKIEFI